MTWYLVAPEGASHEAVTVPSARDRLTEETASGGELVAWGDAEITPANSPRARIPSSKAVKRAVMDILPTSRGSRIAATR